MPSKNEQISALTQVNEDLEKLIAEHELLLDTIAHDIKNPLMSLGMTIEMLKNQAEENKENNPVLIGHIQSSLKQLNKVVNDLVASRWQKYRYQATLELLDVKTILDDVKLTLARQITERKALIKDELKVTQITFIRRKLRSIIYNLLSNAIKYTSENRNPEVLISTHQENGYVVISIADNGMGISETNREVISEKFRQLKSAYEGSGVGLYLVNTIVTAADGKIVIESEPGKGSIFKVYLKQS